jgi:hypothetical protein
MSLSQKTIMDTLENNDIRDVYFYNGKVYFLNQWDEDAIRRLLKDVMPDFSQKNVVYSDQESSYQ